MPGIDLHTHLAPSLTEQVRAGLAGVDTDQDGKLTVGGRPIGPLALYQPLELVSYLDAAGLDSAVVVVPPPFFRQDNPPGSLNSWVRALNDGLLRAVEGHPRLRPLAYLPLEDPQTGLDEYRQLRADGRWAGVTAAAGGRSVSLADAALAPLWRELNADKQLLLLHPATSPDTRLDSFYLSNLLGNPVETAVSVAELVFGGVLAEYADLRVLLVHCGGVLPAVVGRWQRGYNTARPGVDRTVEDPATAVRRFYTDCLAHDPAVVDLAVSVFGEGRIVLGSDWPFPMGTDNPASLISHRGADFVKKASVDNATAVLGVHAVDIEPRTAD
ncbi:amidohydrolase family protein [Streptomyces shenzhenensis]|uniref:amidohydrolase family protein n=1 Tax=Streptomyces shenzhenensis TaxID=943815 RepID=UPI0037FEB05E